MRPATITDPSGRILRFIARATTTAYANDSIKTISTDLTTVEVIVSDGTLVSRGSQWGHVAIEVNGRVYSRSHSTYYVATDKAKYLADNSYRDNVGLVLRVSPAEKLTVSHELDKRVNENKPYNILSNSCSTNVADVLELIGILAHDPRFQVNPQSTDEVSPKEVLLVVSRSSRLAKRVEYIKK